MRISNCNANTYCDCVIVSALIVATTAINMYHSRTCDKSDRNESNDYIN